MVFYSFKNRLDYVTLLQGKRATWSTTSGRRFPSDDIVVKREPINNTEKEVGC